VPPEALPARVCFILHNLLCLALDFLHTSALQPISLWNSFLTTLAIPKEIPQQAIMPGLDPGAESVLAWYGRLQSRRVDLVGDYAGNEYFIIDGDSLLRHCFTDPRIDFKGMYYGGELRLFCFDASTDEHQMASRCYMRSTQLNCFFKT
jgi:hypothetical protein